MPPKNAALEVLMSKRSLNKSDLKKAEEALDELLAREAYADFANAVFKLDARVCVSFFSRSFDSDKASGIASAIAARLRGDCARGAVKRSITVCGEMLINGAEPEALRPLALGISAAASKTAAAFDNAADVFENVLSREEFERFAALDDGADFKTFADKMCGVLYREERLRELSKENSELNEQLDRAFKIDSSNKEQEIAELKNSLAEVLKPELELLEAVGGEVNGDNFIALKSSLVRIFKALKRFGIDIDN